MHVNPNHPNRQALNFISVTRSKKLVDVHTFTSGIICYVHFGTLERSGRMVLMQLPFQSSKILGHWRAACYANGVGIACDIDSYSQVQQVRPVEVQTLVVLYIGIWKRLGRMSVDAIIGTKFQKSRSSTVIYVEWMVRDGPGRYGHCFICTSASCQD